MLECPDIAITLLTSLRACRRKLSLELNKENYSVQGLVFNIQRYSIHDGPGIRTTVFLKGCPLSCWWSHNPEGISTSPELMYSRYKCIGCKSCIAPCPNHALTFNDKLHLKRELCTMSALCVKNCPTTALKIVGERMSVEDVIRELQ